MRFRFRKLYADLVADDGTVLIAYATWTVLGRFRTRRGGIELYAADGQRMVSHAGGPPEVAHGVDGAVEMRLRLPSGAFVLRLGMEHGGWRPVGAAPADGLDWWVEVARARAEARWLNGSRAPLTGIGYADWVELGRPPRRLGLRTLRWGRVHAGDETVVFNALELTGGVWQRAARWRGGRLVDECDSVQVRREDDTAVLVRLGDGRWKRLLTTERVLHAGAALDGDRFPRATERVVTRLLSGSIEETRCLARVPGGWGLHESVRFGGGVPRAGTGCSGPSGRAVEGTAPPGP